MSTTWTLLCERILSWKRENGDHRPPPAKVKLSGFPAESVRAQEGDLRLRTDTHSRPRAAPAACRGGAAPLGAKAGPHWSRSGKETADPQSCAGATRPSSPSLRSERSSSMSGAVLLGGSAQPGRNPNWHPGGSRPAQGTVFFLFFFLYFYLVL